MIRLRRDITERGRSRIGGCSKVIHQVCQIRGVVYTCMYMLFIHACTSVVSVSGFILGVGVFEIG